MGKIKDITGEKFGKLTVLNFDYNKHKWKCKCDCGNITYVMGTKLRNGSNKSCGCERGYNALENLAGQKFNRLTAMEYDREKSKWLCLCECGNTCYVAAYLLKNGYTKSCGCLTEEHILNKDLIGEPHYNRLQTIWRGMIQRCECTYKSNYKYYGGKGIKVCDEWHDFTNFYNWAINNGYEDKLQIDRIDSNKDYCPENCQWLSASENISKMSTSEKIVRLNEMTTDETVKDFIERKLEYMEQNKNKPKPTQFFYRKPTYSQLITIDGTKRYLFKRQRDVCFFLGITYGSLSYRIKKKNGLIGENWKYEKIDKITFDDYRKAGIEVVS